MRTMCRMVGGFLALLLLTVCGSAAFAAGDQEAAKPTIRFAHPFAGGSPGDSDYQAMITKFTDSTKDQVNWQVETAQGGMLRQKITTDLAADNLPDVFFWWALTAMKPMIDAGKILDMKDYLAKSSKVTFADFYDWAWNAYSFDGKSFYGVPLIGYVDFLMANKELFQKYNLAMPKTYDELLAAAKVFADNGIVPVAEGSKSGDPAHFWLGEILFQFVTPNDLAQLKTGGFKFTDPRVRKAVDVVVQSVKGRVFPKDTLGSGDYGPAIAMYNQGKAAMMLAETWSIPSISAEIVAKSAIIPFPRVKDAPYDAASQIIGGVNNCYAIQKSSFNDSKKQKAVVALMDFLLGDEQIASFVTTSRNNVYKKLKLDISKVNVLPLFRMSNDATEKMAKLPNLYIALPYAQTQEIMLKGCDQLWAGTMTTDEFVTKMQESVEIQNAAQK
jgi:raffinose/stachyose/melibiose transport system substrate-binding protein